MKSDELAVIFAKLPDYQVCDALSKMDEKKAGKVLVALPPTRAAKLTVMLNRATAAPAGQQAVR
jgi:flagellar motility protein MotE (MotC chaperone)